MRRHNTQGMSLLNTTGSVHVRSLRRLLLLTNLWISLLSPQLKHMFAEVEMHGLRIYLRAIPTTWLMPKCSFLTCLHPESVNMLYWQGPLRTCRWTPLSAHGIPRALWGDVPSIEPMFDILKKLHPKETQHPCECGSLTARTRLSYEWCNSHQFSVALCCIVAGKGDVPLQYRKITQKTLTKKWALLANFDLR